MGIKNYKGGGSRLLWENDTFKKGMHYTGTELSDGQTKVIANMDTDTTGGSLKPRHPIYSVLFKFPDNDIPQPLPSDTFMFSSTQDNDKTFFISINKANTQSSEIIRTFDNGDVDPGFEVIDGDTIKDTVTNEYYRLLFVDTPEKGTAYATDATNCLTDFLNNCDTFDAVRDNSQISIDQYGRHLVWLIRDDGQTAQRELLWNGYAAFWGELEEDYDPVKSPTIYFSKSNDYWPEQNDLIVAWNTAEATNKGIWSEPFTINGDVEFIGQSNCISILSKSADTVLTPYNADIEQDPVTLPAIEVNFENDRIDYSPVYEDLSSLFETDDWSIEIKEFIYSDDQEIFRYENVRKPFTRVDHIDGVAFLGKITQGSTTVYEGLITIQYYVPLVNNKPEWNAYRFLVKTYENTPNVTNIKAEDFQYKDMNLLDEKIDTFQSLQGDEAKEKGYSKHTVRGIELLNSDFKRVTEPWEQRDYHIMAVTAVPPLSKDDLANGYKGYATVVEVYDYENGVWKAGTNQNTSQLLPISFTYMSHDYLGRSLLTYPVTPSGMYQVYDTSGGDFDDDLHYCVAAGIPDGILPTNMSGTVPAATVNSVLGVNEEMSFVDYVQELIKQGSGIHTSKDIVSYQRPNQIAIRVGLMKVKLKSVDSLPASFDLGTASHNGILEHYSYPTSADETQNYKRMLELDADEEYTGIDSKGFRERDGSYFTLYRQWNREESLLDTSIFNHNIKLNKADSIFYHDGHLGLYGRGTGANAVFLSDPNDTGVGYFPFSNVIDAFHGDLIHVHSHSQWLAIFTTSGIFIAEEQPINEEGKTAWVTIPVYNNLAIKNIDRATIASVGKDIFFMSDNKGYLLRPNPYSDLASDMYLQEITEPIAGLMDNPTPYVTDRLQYYSVIGNVYDSNWKPFIHRHTHIRDNKIYLYYSVSINMLDDPETTPADETLDARLMIIFIYDIKTKTWKTYDTKATSYPTQFEIFSADEGTLALCNNHRTIGDGVTLMLSSCLNLWDFDQGYGRYFDIKSVRLDNNTFVVNSNAIDNIEQTKMPINCFIDSGYPNITPHLFKRYHRLQWDITNIDCDVLPISVEFRVDGHIRQTSSSVRLTHDADAGVISQIYEYLPNMQVDNAGAYGTIGFKDWQLGMNRFGPLNRTKVDFGISGRGRLPSFKVAFRTTGLFELHKYGIIFKEQGSNR